MENDSNEKVDNPQSIGLFFKAVSLVFLLLALGASFLLGLFRTQDVSELIGFTISPLFSCLLLIAIFSIGKRFRTASARYKIVFYSSLIIFLVQMFNFLAIVGSKIGEKH